MSEQILQVGNITFERPAPRVIRVVKAKERNETPQAKRERLDIAMLKMLIPEYPDLARELVSALVK